MGKRDNLVKELRPIIDDRGMLEKFIVRNSNLPGPRANLELAFAFAEIYDDLGTLLEWTEITEDQADGNDPKSFLVFCSAVCLGKIYAKKKDKRIVAVLKKLSNDRRWRMREAAAFGFQNIGMQDFGELKTIFSEWIDKSNNLEKRAILVSLAHLPLLSEEDVRFCLETTDTVLRQMDREEEFAVLRKGLGFTISVFASANPELGFGFIRNWMGKDRVIDRIMKENLKKNRLLKRFPKEARDLLKVRTGDCSD